MFTNRKMRVRGRASCRTRKRIMKRIFCKIEKCLACRSCELACAAAHVIQRPRIHVQAIDEKGTLSRTRAIAIQCRNCEEPACVLACISGGIRKDESSGTITVNLENCVGCWSCIMVCPVGAITRNDNMHQALKCDHCPDLENPACILACPTAALIVCDDAVMESK
jgi:anaerobic carbon-monoxide dehydrogenase iron sulfur subunit